MVRLERNAQPLERRGAGEFDFTALLQLLQEFWSAEQRLTGAENVFDEAARGFSGSGGGLLLIDEIREAD